ncbi:MAG: peptidoglycan-associated lipoprotein Pal [Desulfobacteraceae bacterium]|nr:peptidoglycan-associated lipoprotein Pal [Desulfobacteraceae bacterium]
MKKRVFANLLMALLVAGLFLTVSCAQKKVTSDPTTESSQKTTEQKTASAAENPLKPVATGDPDVDFINLDIYFDFDSAVLTPESQALLQSKAAYLKEKGGINVVIQGHCDERGTTEYNLALGERRAKSAKDFLVDLGISNSRLGIISYGEEQPADPSHTKDAWERNRRGHFELN